MSQVAVEDIVEEMDKMVEDYQSRIRWLRVMLDGNLRRPGCKPPEADAAK